MNRTAESKDPGNILPRPSTLPCFSRPLFDLRGIERQTEMEGERMGMCLRKMWMNHMYSELTLTLKPPTQVDPEGAPGFRLWGHCFSRALVARLTVAIPRQVGIGFALCPRWNCASLRLQIKNQKSPVSVKFPQAQTHEILEFLGTAMQASASQAK